MDRTNSTSLPPIPFFNIRNLFCMSGTRKTPFHLRLPGVFRHHMYVLEANSHFAIAFVLSGITIDLAVVNAWSPDIRHTVARG
ncbi:hypothetical protein BJV78DRAFT_1365693 [Lactifluus subvellereus]|nr:hypothetical protein BJV78DRAFT_1365693 [Lactifluus subvellereus]